MANMRVLIAVSGNNDGGADPIAAMASLPWPKETIFSVLTVAETVSPPAMVELLPGALDVSDVQRRTDVVAGTISSNAASQLRGYGFTADGVSMEGDPKDMIVEHANKWQADLVVVGSGDRSRLEKFFLGSVSQSVVTHAPCSVLVIKPKQPLD
jgi:nucleotide-binding universal stress UspA family protein